MARTKSVTPQKRPSLATRFADGPLTPDVSGSKRPRAQSPKQGGKSQKKTNTTERSRSPKSTKGAQKKGKASATSRDAALESPESPQQRLSPRLKAKAAAANEDTLPISTPKGKTTTPIPILTPPNKSSKAVKEAWQCIQRHCGTSICSINNTMWLYLWPLYVNSEGELVVSNLDCNWNVWNDKLGLEITLNILHNADGTHTKLHAPFAGHDMTILMANDEQVRLCNYLHFVYFYKILFSSLTFVSCGKSVIRVYSYCPPNVSLVIIQSLIWHKRRPQHTLIYIRTLYLIVLILYVPRPGVLTS